MQTGKFMSKEKYYTHKREPFFEIAKKYISEDSVVLDIGSGVGAFPDYCKRDDFYLFDGNQATVDLLKRKYKHVVCGLLPTLPFESDFFDVIHCSHVVEHLEPHVFYETLKEMNRCLKVGGYLVVSAPLMWSGFYNDLSHVRPYNPKVYRNYLCGEQKDSRTRSLISTSYKQEQLIYRYLADDNIINYYSGKASWLISFFIKTLNWIRSRGFTFLEKTGYTIVLRKY